MDHIASWATSVLAETCDVITASLGYRPLVATRFMLNNCPSSAPTVSVGVQVDLPLRYPLVDAGVPLEALEGDDKRQRAVPLRYNKRPLEDHSLEGDDKRQRAIVDASGHVDASLASDHVDAGVIDQQPEAPDQVSALASPP